MLYYTILYPLFAITVAFLEQIFNKCLNECTIIANAWPCTNISPDYLEILVW